MAEADRKPFWARCSHCGHCWPVAYTPLCMATFAGIIARAVCPNCGAAKGLKIARQCDGVLLEPGARGLAALGGADTPTPDPSPNSERGENPRCFFSPSPLNCGAATEGCTGSWG